MPRAPSAKRTRQQSQQSRKHQATDNHLTIFDAGTVVTTKYGDYPWWPAVIMDSRHIPKHIRDDKPLAGLYYCVRFMDDGQYAWIAEENIRTLSKDYAREWLREHAEKGNRRVAFERAKNPERWVRVALEVTRLEVVLKEMPIGAMDESNEDTKGVERPEVDPIDLTGDSDDEMCCDERAMPNYSWIRDEIPSTPDTSSARELHWLEGAFSEYQAALMDKREVIEKFDFHRRKLKGALEKTERFIAAKKSEYIHLGINPATKTFGLRQLEERKRQVEEAMKKLESETTLGNDGSSLKRPRSTNASFNSAFSPRRGHNPSFSL